MSIAVLLKKNKKKANGEIPVYLRFTKNRKPEFISLGFSVLPEHWDERKQRVKAKAPNATIRNAFIAKKVAEIEEKAMQNSIQGKTVSGKILKEVVAGANTGSVIQYLRNYRDRLSHENKYGTYVKYKAVLSKLEEYLKGKDLSFGELNYQFVKEYDRYLRDVKKNKDNTVYSNLKILRKICRDAVLDDLIRPDQNPFTKFKLSPQKIVKDFLEEEELRAMEQLALEPGTRIFDHRNLFVFSCYAGGIRISDALQLKWQNFDGTHIRFKIQKTGELSTIKLPSKALEIISLYGNGENKKPDSYIFPFLEKGKYSKADVVSLMKAISSHTAYANKNLKKIAAAAGISKKVHFHMSRHSFSVNILKKGASIDVVSKILAHASVKTTQIYAKIVNQTIDNAMDLLG